MGKLKKWKLWAGGQVVVEESAGGTSVTYEASLTRADGITYIYVLVIADGELSWSAPVWIDEKLL